MKNFGYFLPLLAMIFAVTGFTALSAQKLDGSWSLQGNDNHLLLVQDNYFSWTEVDDQDQFINTLGGTIDRQGDQLNISIEFNANDRYMVGQTFKTSFTLKDGVLTALHPEGYNLTWIRMEESDQGLAGVWRISGRKVNGELNSISKSARKTYKLLTPGHFQWIAMNTDTGEFFGTGGGRYTFENGKYTEHIEFFSRDNSRVGASLIFDGELKNGDWHHSGKSSKGHPIYEIWSRE